MPAFKKYSGLKYASFTAWRNYDRLLTLQMKKGTNYVEIFPFSLLSALLNHKVHIKETPTAAFTASREAKKQRYSCAC